MDNTEQEREYVKSRFRCPICGTLIGCSEDGKVAIFGIKAFRRHVKNCRNSSRVKSGKIRYNDEN